MNPLETDFPLTNAPRENPLLSHIQYFADHNTNYFLLKFSDVHL